MVLNDEPLRELGHVLRATELLYLLKQIECKVCCSSYHMKCLSLSPDDHEYMRANTSTWYCRLCVTQIFPLNTIEDDDMFLCELNGIDINDYTIDSLSCRLFNHFQLNDKDYYTPLSQIDPDVNFYNNVDSHLGLSCNYYPENTFYELVKSQMYNSTTENVFSLCLLNISSLRPNLSAFELTLHNLICNISLQQGIFPDELKIANVLPLFKACDPCVFDNYRPVSLLCVLSKVYEKLMYNRLIPFLENFDILFENQFDLRKLHSSYLAFSGSHG